MRLMEERILSEGRVLPGYILKVGSFFNQQIDIELLRAAGEEIAALYGDCGVNKILTIEASGIALATASGLSMGVPVVFAKKHKSSNVGDDVISARIHSYTHGGDYDAVVSGEYLRRGDRVLIVDDFLAKGCALRGLIELAEKAGAEVVGAAIGIEKGFQGGGDDLRSRGVRIESLAVIDEMDGDKITFRKSV
ncbi:MAG: xanthine phosphoribosyltransferase [Oscillospiraceae bacterium]|nr:xanthine phosphoribosyltransferase [Oscillospiraceae bacterium]